MTQAKNHKQTQIRLLENNIRIVFANVNGILVYV